VPTAIGGVIALGGVIASIVIATSGPSSGGVFSNFGDSSSSESSSPEANTRSDLRNLATAEETYLTDYDAYTADGTALANEGFHRDPGDSSTLLAGFDGTRGYCLVGSPNGSSSWYLYDSQAGGLNQSPFASSSAAEADCSDATIANYGPA
jgi:hypothetical protein